MKTIYLEIAKSIFDAIQVKVANNSTTKFLNFSFKDGEFEKYFFTDDMFDSTDGVDYWGIELNEYVNMSIEDIVSELQAALKVFKV